jgi:Uma2 family endonuclease
LEKGRTFGESFFVGIITHISQLDKSKTYSYADYLTWRFEEFVELIKGKVFMMSPALAMRHQAIASRLHGIIFQYFRLHHCSTFFAPFDVRLVKGKQADEDILTVVQPDICVVCDETKLDDRGCVGAPDWIIEILSPASSKKDLNEKYNLYEENGVREYWVVFPDSNIINQYVLQDGVYQYINSFPQSARLAPAIFPELVVNLEEVFGK